MLLLFIKKVEMVKYFDFFVISAISAYVDLINVEIIICNGS